MRITLTSIMVDDQAKALWFYSSRRVPVDHRHVSGITR
jgi:hypothetical protein